MRNDEATVNMEEKRREFMTAFQQYIQSGASNDEVYDEIELTTGAMRALLEFLS